MAKMRLRLRIGKFICLAAVFVGASAQLRAQATLLLEEPYSYDGTFAGTGHSAVYLSRVCAESPTMLRHCQPGETGVVLSRYHRIAGRDWIAVPLIPYLYSVNNPQDIPLVTDERLVKVLRDDYLESVNLNEGRSYQLAGSAYDRTTYGFRIATRPEQDDELIRILNSAPNHESYKLLNRNCADFAKQIINFYYPKAIHRSIIADLGVMTPKQAAKSLVHSGKRHPEMQLTTFIIPQVPGLKRSKPVHGIIESVVLAKKYVTPVLLFHPFVVGTVEAAYWAGWRFNPAKGALIFDASSWDFSDPRNALERPLTNAERRSYERSLFDAKRASIEAELPEWGKLQATAEPQLDAAGQPFLKTETEGHSVLLGLSRGNALRLSAPPEFTQQLVLTRLEHELKSSKPPRASRRQIESDWKLLQRAVEAREAELNAPR
jgi:hypothetical protein